MHGRHGGVPRRLKRGQPSGEAVGVKSGGTHDARARRERGNQVAMETMPVEQGHDIQASIGFFQRECRSVRVRRCAHAGVRLRDDFRPRGRARRGQQHRGVAGADRLVGGAAPSWSPVSVKRPAASVGGGRQLDDTDAPSERHTPRRGVRSSRRESMHEGADQRNICPVRSAPYAGFIGAHAALAATVRIATANSGPFGSTTAIRS